MVDHIIVQNHLRSGDFENCQNKPQAFFPKLPSSHAITSTNCIFLLVYVDFCDRNLYKTNIIIGYFYY